MWQEDMGLERPICHQWGGVSHSPCPGAWGWEKVAPLARKKDILNNTGHEFGNRGQGGGGKRDISSARGKENRKDLFFIGSRKTMYNGGIGEEGVKRPEAKEREWSKSLHP